MSIFADDVLFSNTELSENVSQDFVGGDITGDAAEVVEGVAEVLGDKVGRDTRSNTVTDIHQGSGGIAQSIVVTQVCDKIGVAGLVQTVLLGVCQGFFQLINT